MKIIITIQLLFAVLLLSGCMDPIYNYNECVEIETARCNVREECKGDKTFDKSYPNFDVKSCISYAKEHCRTRKIKGDNWDQKNVDSCSAAILQLKDDCRTLTPKGVDETEELSECSFIEGNDTDSTASDSEDAGS